MIKLNQKGVIQFIPLIILLAGIVGGVDLVQHPQILKPKAYETKLPLTQYDEPPPLLTSIDNGAESILKDAARAGGYSLTFNQTEDEITIEFNPEDLTEDEAKILLKNNEGYYLRMLMWLLLDPFGKIDGPPIDPWYALCEHLDAELLAKIGADETYLKAEEGQDAKRLECSDPQPTIDQFNPTDSHIHFVYKKIPAKVLEIMIEAAKLERENKEQSVNASELAVSMIPIFGPFINAIDTPGASPDEVFIKARDEIAQDALANTLLPVAGSIISRGGKVVRTLGAKAGARFVMVGQSVFSHRNKVILLNLLRANQNFKVKLVKGAFPEKYPLADEYIWKTLYTLIPENKAIVFGQAITRPVMDKVVERVQSLIDRGAIKGVSLDRNKIYEVIDNGWVVSVRDDVFDEVFGLQGADAGTFGRTVLVRASHGNDPFVLAHEFVHVINKTITGVGVTTGKYFAYGQGQQDRYGHIMSALYELATDDLAGFALGTQDTVYKQVYPHLYNSLTSLVQFLIHQSNGRFTLADLKEFALTADDTAVLKKVLGAENPQRFVELLENRVDFNALEAIYKANIARRQKVANDIKALAAGVEIGILTDLGIIALGSSEESEGEENMMIYPQIYGEDRSIFNPGSLNCSYSQVDKSCPKGTTICTGYTVDTICDNSTPEECLNLAQCLYNANQGSSCQCSE